MSKNEWVHVITKDKHTVAIPANDIQYHRVDGVVYWDRINNRYRSKRTAMELILQPNVYVVETRSERESKADNDSR